MRVPTGHSAPKAPIHTRWCASKSAPNGREAICVEIAHDPVCGSTPLWRISLLSTPNSSETENSAAFLLSGGAVLLSIVLIAVLFGARLFIQPANHSRSIANHDRFSFSAQCEVDHLNCMLTLSNDAHSTHLLSVKSFRSLPIGVIFLPQSVIVQPGETIEITVILLNHVCPLQVILMQAFAGQPFQDVPFLVVSNCGI